MKSLQAIAASLLIAISAPLYAQTTAPMTRAEVRTVDKDAKKITLRHEQIKSLDMPAMTMVFQVREPAMLEQVKVGDKVRFSAEKLDAGYTVMHIEMEGR